MEVKTIRKQVILVITMAFLVTLLAGADTVHATNSLTGGWGGTNDTNVTATAGAVNVTLNVTNDDNTAFNSVSNGTMNTTSAYYSNASVAGQTSLQFVVYWDTTADEATTDIDLPTDDKGTAYITFTFSRPVENPILHIDRLGGMGGNDNPFPMPDAYYSNGASFTLVTSGLTLTKLAGVDHLQVNSTSFWRTGDVFSSTPMLSEATWDSTKGTAAGSVMINGIVSSVTFAVTGVGVEGSGGDGIEFVWELNPTLDLAVSKVDNPDPVVAGQTLTYTITVTNNGPSSIIPSDTFTVIDTLPVSFTPSSYTPSAGTYDPATGAWTGVTLDSGDSVTLTITGIVSSTESGTLTNTVIVTPPAGVTDTNSANDESTPISTEVDGLPVANDDNQSTSEDTPLSGTLPATDPEGPIALVSFVISGTSYTPGSSVNIPGVGTVTIYEDGTYEFTPEPNYNGPVPQITYTVADGTGNTDSGVLDITVNPVNDAPVAVADAPVTDEDVPVSGAVAISDVDGDAMTCSLDPVDGPENGSVVVNPDGTYTYTPDADFNGVDSFTILVDDGNGGVTPVLVSVTVNPVNDAPVAVDDYVTTPEDTPVTISVLDNDSDIDGDVIMVISVTQPADCTAVINPDGTVTYTSDPNYYGPDSFTYTISDGHGGIITATVYIEVISVDDLPVAINDFITIEQDPADPGNLAFSGSVATNDALSGDGGNNWQLVNLPLHGTIVFNPDGTFTYTPDPKFNGMDSFTYEMIDADGDVSTATVSFNVNDPADLSLTKTVDKNKVVIGDTLHFTLIVQNHGPDTAVDVKVTEVMPEGLKYVSYTTNYGTYDPITGIWSIGNLPNGKIATLTVTSIVTNTGKIVNRANVESMTYDPVIDNNEASVLVTASEKTTSSVPMQNTGMPLFMLIMAFLMVFAGFTSKIRK